MKSVLLKGGSSVNLNYEDLRKAVLTLRAVNHKLRQRMIDLLDEHLELSVTDIFVKLRLEQSVASQHLAILRRARIVKTVRQGKFILYSLDRDRLDEVRHLIEDLTTV